MAASASEERDLKKKSEVALARATDPLDKLRLQCLARGVTGIRGIGRMFKIWDDSGSKSIDRAEFEKGVRDYGILLNPGEFGQLFQRIDKDGTGSISYDELLDSIRPPMNARRKKMVNLAFNKLDRTNDGKFTIEDLKGVYDARKHPKYVNGEWTEDRILQEFIKNFDDKSSPDGTVTRGEFLNYYSGVSASIDEDPYFELMMRNAYKL